MGYNRDQIDTYRGNIKTYIDDIPKNLIKMRRTDDNGKQQKTWGIYKII